MIIVQFKSQNICGSDGYLKYKLSTDENFKKRHLDSKRIVINANALKQVGEEPL
ncbi:MAG: hypothetical protein SGJ15_12295 [Bacteroidota bacterium]|nr:hypothetical protein [Bacteroidota bacterium]